MMSAVRSIYVIMPIGSDPLAEEKKHVLRAAIKDCGREVIFPVYSLDQSSFSITNFIEKIRNVDAVLADLSQERPSCYYELGIVEAIGKSVHLIAQTGTPIHQCANRKAIRYYLDLADIQWAVRSALNGKVNGS